MIRKDKIAYIHVSHISKQISLLTAVSDALSEKDDVGLDDIKAKIDEVLQFLQKVEYAAA